MKDGNSSPFGIWNAGTYGGNDPMPDLNVVIPRRLAARIESYAEAHGTDSSHVVIEAIDSFLRERSNRVWL